MKFIYFFLLLILLSGCATIHRMNRVNLGMSKNDVINAMGEPKTTAAKGDTEYMIYHLYKTDDAAFFDIQTPYFIRLKNGKVDAYGEKGDFDSTREDTNVIKFQGDIKTNYVPLPQKR